MYQSDGRNVRKSITLTCWGLPTRELVNPNVKLMPEVQHRAPRRETSIPVPSSTHQPGRHHTLDGPNGGGTLP
ncbi:hypothetical protein M8J77_022520 [Diaphorina citri]|nr:hypothetical protein M8J77_022520 [Diaphorina citri]